MEKNTAQSSVAAIGIDLGKRFMQVHGVDAAGTAVLVRKLSRAQMESFFERLPPTQIGLEACASAHHWARLLLRQGHKVRLIPPAYVKAYVRRQKTDAADAAAVCEALTRPARRFLAVKSEAQQGALMLHRVRSLLVGQRTAAINALRGHMAEFGIVAPQGAHQAAGLVRIVADESDRRLCPEARAALRILCDELASAEARIAALDARIKAVHQADERSRRLATIPGIGPLSASALAASVADPAMFASGREFAAWLGLAPRQSSTGGKERLGRISKMGDRYLRSLLVVGAHAVLFHRKGHQDALRQWAGRLAGRKPFKLAAVALANKLARIAWAVMARGEVYRGTATIAA
ncbi:MAG: IS110 family transposase [Alphaproteobacteria bacterium]|nr:IS110 family transposase [Alphaproteobacteria bacterium]